MNKTLVSCMCLAALATTGCHTASDRWDWQNIDVGKYIPHVTTIAKAATINLLKEADVERIEIVRATADVVSKALDNDINIDPNSAVQQVRALVEQYAPDIAADKGIMSLVDVAVSIAVGQVDNLVRRYGPKFDQSDMTVRLIQAALFGVQQGAGELLLPGGPPQIPGPN